MPTSHHGDVELFFEVFGSATGPTLLLINGLGSQCINYDEQWCEKFAGQGYRVIRFDYRDTGLSSKLDGRAYALRDMAGDAVVVLDDANAQRAHVMGLSMGGMIAQRLAIDHSDRLLSLTSVMSSSGEPEYGQSSPEARAVVMANPPRLVTNMSTTRSPRGGSTGRSRSGSTSRTCEHARRGRSTVATAPPASGVRCRQLCATVIAPTPYAH